MFVPDSAYQSPLYTAEPAYQLREFTRSKRYESSEIKADTVNLDSPYRAEVETFIANVFYQNYQARITSFLPELVALRDHNGVLMAAFGLMNASNRKLFLEQYIDLPVEALIYQQLGILIPRDKITYIGNLAVANPRNAGILMKCVIEHSLQLQLPWAVATMHHSLQNGLIKAGRDLYALGDAAPDRLTHEEQLRWGRYYHRTPQIVAIRGIDDTAIMSRLSNQDNRL